MDLLSRLLSLTPVNGALDVRCHYGEPWRHAYRAAGEREIPYHILLSGTAMVENGDQPPLQMQAGDIVLFPSGAAHVLFNGNTKHAVAPVKSREHGLTIMSNGAQGDPPTMLCGRFLLPPASQGLLRSHLPGTMLVRCIDGRSPHASEAEAVAGSRLSRLIQLMMEEAIEHGPGSEAMMNHLSGALFGLTLRFASAAAAPPRGLLALAGNARLQPAFDAMFEQPGEPWSQPQLAEKCLMSRATFARHFSDATGRSATDFLLEVRMAVASRKLIETSLSVAEIGEQVGYQSDAAFQRVFKKQLGLTPAQWRAQSRMQTAPAE
jgi:AraC family transcriptional activator of mtrCDE